MFKSLLLSIGALGVLMVTTTNAQNPGDTIKVRTFHYGSSNRDTVAHFPTGNLTFEKIIMRYSMRCKNGLVSTGTERNKGCGEWDYSCNTYIVDSTKVEEVGASQPEYVISNFTGTTFPYTTQPVFDYYRYTQQQVAVTNTITENLRTVLTGSDPNSTLMKTDEVSGRSMILYTASELTTAGVTAGDLNAIILKVANAGGWAHFLKVKIKHTTADSVNSTNPELSGYTEVYNSDYLFANGDNRIHFNSPFVWDGVSNVLIVLSYTNTVPSTPVIFEGQSVSARSMALAANNNYSVDMVHMANASLDVSNMATVSNEITISFWAFGEASMMPVNTTLLYGSDNNFNNRQLNIHLPYGNSNIYFDCGFTQGAYDRVNKVATAAEQGGRWNHWTFTKNATTGSMKIYLNGVLWTSATGMTKPITILNLLLNNYKGKISELAIWNKEMSASTLTAWMLQPSHVNHPMAANLVSYYAMNEGARQNITNGVTSVTVTGKNLRWANERGDKLFRDFTETSFRPAIQFAQGSYQLALTDTLIIDSVKRSAVTVNKYKIITNTGVSDEVILDTTYDSYYAVSPSKIFNGDSGAQVDSIIVAAEGQLLIAQLPYVQRYPFYNEIMSFVTPYGIGLDLGMEGKAWYFDVSDYAPLLKNDKRIVMTLGGQTQEQNDIEFWFIVGTPPHTVLEFNQLWQGAARANNASIANILNDSRFPALNVPLLSTGKSFKVRSSITGHGASGEFESNGGPIQHMLNINGGNPEFAWNVSRKCSMNPVFPQGGTWIYARQGWCPGMPTLLTEHDITSLVTAGSNTLIDYGISQPLGSGEYQYVEAHQLVTYGDPNFQTDARVLDVVQPSTKIEYGRINPGCADPKIVIQNTGSKAVTSIEIKYYINNNPSYTYTWKGNLAFMEIDTINLPVGKLWSKGTLAANNMFYAEIVKVNNQTDENVLNNKIGSAFARPDVIPQKFAVEFRTNNFPGENRYKLLDANGKVVDQKTFATGNTSYTYNYNMVGCFRLVVEDSGEDGVSFWANSSQGTGYVRLKRESGSIIKTFQPDFGGGFEYAFTTNWTLDVEEPQASVFGAMLNLFPNPSTGIVNIEGDDLEGASVLVTDVLGRVVIAPRVVETPFVKLDHSSLQKGMYFVVIDKNGQRAVKELMVQ